MNIVLLYAMQAEAEPFLQAVDAHEVDCPGASWLPFRLFQFCLHEQRVHAMVSGADARFQVDNIGLEPATLMAYTAIHHLAPDLLISAGTAGGFDALGATIGTVYLADHFLFHDRHVPLEGFEQSALSLVSTFDAKTLAEQLQLPRVTASSGSSLKRSADDIAVMKLHHVGAKEMEAAAIAWVAQLSNTPLLAIKSITNVLEHEESSEAQFTRHFALAVQALTHQTKRVLSALLLQQNESGQAQKGH